MSRILPMMTLVVAVAAAVGSSTGASASMVDSTRLAQVACTQIGLSAGQVQFDDCVSTLERSVESANPTVMAEPAGQACTQAGLRPGTPAFSNCIANLDQTLRQDASSHG